MLYRESLWEYLPLLELCTTRILPTSFCHIKQEQFWLDSTVWQGLPVGLGRLKVLF